MTRSLLTLATVAFSTIHNAHAFGPEELLSAPRVNIPVPNKAGTLALYSSSSYSFENHRLRQTWNLLNISNTETVELSENNVGEATWFGTDDYTILLKNATANGETNFWLADARDPIERRHVGTIKGLINNVKPLSSNGTVHLVFTAKSTTDGNIYNRNTAPRQWATGMVYDSLFVRHWDHYIFPEKSQLYSVSFHNKSGQYSLKEDSITNLFGKNSRLETPIEPFGGAGDFAVSSDGNHVAFISKNPDLNPANNTQSLLYLVPVTGWHAPSTLNRPTADAVDAHGKRLPEGATASPVFSPDGHTLAYLQMYRNGYESDTNKIFIVRYKSNPIPIVPDWDVSPASLFWAPDGKSLYVVADNDGRMKLYNIRLPAPKPDDDPRISNKVTEVYSTSSVHGIRVLPNNKLILGISSLVASPRPFLFDPSDRDNLVPLLPKPEHEKSLSPSQIQPFQFTSVLGYNVHGWIVKPSYFDETKKYPMAFFIHGGPQGNWGNQWSTRWNPAIFAEHGYVVVAVNPTGSTGYGQEFVDAIKGQWGGRPYVDLSNAFEHIENNKDYSYIDTTRAVALGASYGGYMINWIQGQPLGRKFKALVCHDGVFSTLSQYASDELYFPTHDFGAPLWLDRSGYEKWDPAAHTANWETPEMIIHSERDFRLPVTEGLAVFNVLQEKGVPSRLLVFPDENHWVLKHENGLMWHREVMRWIDQWSGVGQKDGDKDGDGEKVQGEKVEEEESNKSEIEDAKRLKKLVPVGSAKQVTFTGDSTYLTGEPLQEL